MRALKARIRSLWRSRQGGRPRPVPLLWTATIITHGFSSMIQNEFGFLLPAHFPHWHEGE